MQDAHVLVIGPATDPKLILKTQHIGADEYLDAATLDTELSAALVRFNARCASVARHDKPGRVIFPYLVIDLDNRPSSEQAEVLWQSDLTLLVVRLDYTSVRNARRTIDGLKEWRVGLSSLYVVVNRYGQAKQLRISQAEEALGMSILHCLPCNPAPIHHSLNSGVPVVL